MARGVTLITGASAGLGAEFARQCRRRGDELVLVARRRDRLEALAAELGSAHIVVADLALPGAPGRLLAEVEGLGLEVETLINNAGFGLTGRLADAAPERLLEMIDLNVRALTELCRLVLPGMVERKRGGLLNVASTAAFQAGPNMAVYYASKAYVLSLTEAIHQEMKGTAVKVTALCPGPTATEFFDVAEARGSTLAKMATDPAGVVRAGLRGLDKNRAIVIPGIANKIGAQGSRFLPRAAMRRVIARIKM
jgi:uncharacterized protein